MVEVCEGTLAQSQTIKVMGMLVNSPRSTGRLDRHTKIDLNVPCLFLFQVLIPRFCLVTTDTDRRLGPYRQEINSGRNLSRGMMVYRRMHLSNDSKTTGVEVGEAVQNPGNSFSSYSKYN